MRREEKEEEEGEKSGSEEWDTRHLCSIGDNSGTIGNMSEKVRPE